MITKIRFHVKSVILLIVCISIGLGIGLISTRAYANVNGASSQAIDPVSKTGVTMSIANGTVGQDITDVTACFDLPSNGDWFPEGVLKDGTTTFQPQKIVLLNWRDPQTLAGKHRCFQFIFKTKASQTAKLLVTELKTSVPETLTQADCDRALSKIKQRVVGFAFSCTIDKHGVAFNLQNFPEGMTDAQAGKLIEDALTETTDGPWEFPIVK
jgi:hypothetical protein